MTTKIAYVKTYIDCCDTRCPHFQRIRGDPAVYGHCARFLTHKPVTMSEIADKPFPDFCQLEDF